VLVCLSDFPHGILKSIKTDAARITKRDAEMFYDESVNLFILGSKGRGREAQKSVPAVA